MHDGRTRSRLPAKSTSQEKEDQNQRKSAFERLGPSGSHNRESRRDHSQSNRVEQPKEIRSRAPIGTLKEITPSEIATPSMIDTRERIVRGASKKTIRKKKKTTTKTRDSKNPGGQ